MPAAAVETQASRRHTAAAISDNKGGGGRSFINLSSVSSSSNANSNSNRSRIAICTQQRAEGFVAVVFDAYPFEVVAAPTAASPGGGGGGRGSAASPSSAIDASVDARGVGGVSPKPPHAEVKYRFNIVYFAEIRFSPRDAASDSDGAFLHFEFFFFFSWCFSSTNSIQKLDV